MANQPMSMKNKLAMRKPSGREGKWWKHLGMTKVKNSGVRVLMVVFFVITASIVTDLRIWSVSNGE